MSPAARLSGLLDNLAGARDEALVVHAATDVLAPPRFDPRDAGMRLSGEDEATYAAWSLCWAPLRLDGLLGFPLWERQVHDQLHISPISPLISPISPRSGSGRCTTSCTHC